MSQNSVSSVDFGSLNREIDELLNTEDNTMATHQQQQQQHWTPLQTKLIEEYRLFYKKMGMLVDDIQLNGPTGKLPKMSKRPKQRLNDIYAQKKVRKEEMDTHQLHKYLCENIADTDHLILRETFSEELFSKASSEQEIVDRLQKGVRNLKRQDSQTLMIYIQFGNFLNLAKSWVEEEKKKESSTSLGLYG